VHKLWTVADLATAADQRIVPGLCDEPDQAVTDHRQQMAEYRAKAMDIMAWSPLTYDEFRDVVTKEQHPDDIDALETVDTIAAALEQAAAEARADVVRAVEKITTPSDDGNEYEHVTGCEGEVECPACWVADIRAALAAGREGGVVRGGPWRVGQHYGIHVYEVTAAGDDRPVATFHRAEDAARAVAAVLAAAVAPEDDGSPM
jgi:hypothetical protein